MLHFQPMSVDLEVTPIKCHLTKVSETLVDFGYTAEDLLFDWEMQVSESVLDVTLKIIDPSTIPEWPGPYQIEPRKIDQVFGTMDHRFSKNLTVEKIYCSRELNEAGGYTVTIGKE